MSLPQGFEKRVVTDNQNQDNQRNVRPRTKTLINFTKLRDSLASKLGTNPVKSILPTTDIIYVTELEDNEVEAIRTRGERPEFDVEIKGVRITAPKLKRNSKSLDPKEFTDVVSSSVKCAIDGLKEIYAQQYNERAKFVTESMQYEHGPLLDALKELIIWERLVLRTNTIYTMIFRALGVKTDYFTFIMNLRPISGYEASIISTTDQFTFVKLDNTTSCYIGALTGVTLQPMRCNYGLVNTIQFKSRLEMADAKLPAFVGLTIDGSTPISDQLVSVNPKSLSPGSKVVMSNGTGSPATTPKTPVTQPAPSTPSDGSGNESDAL